MSWDAELVATHTRTCPHCGGVLERSEDEVGWWNYTHNTNGMIAAAYEAVSGESTPDMKSTITAIIGDALKPAWWDRLDGKSGAEGAEYLSAIIKGLEADPERFRAMNPDNGWGDYDRLLRVLREMRDAVPADPSVWRVSG